VSKRPKLIASDLDGTIVSHKGVISQRTIDAFTRARDLGVHVFFVTGRPPRWMGEIREAFGFGEAICCNGAMLYDLINDVVLEEWMISVDDQLEVVRRMRIAMPEMSFAVESNDHYHREIAYVPKWDIGMDNVGVERIEDAITRPALKILGRCSNHEFTSDEMVEVAHRECKDLVTVTHSTSRDSLIEISALNISKGSTLEMMAKRLGLTAEDCVSFGDNPNDFSMLQWAGRSYAMTGGHPHASSFAKAVAEPCEADGVAKIIEELLELPA
jgi:Cof subfamily protein (haloacid dehalogenase superfamily)